MSTTIDSRIVEMKFNNREFERNVSTSLSTLEKLKEGLNLSGAAKGLDNVNTAAKGINLAPLGQAVETVGLKFNAMYTIADQVLRNITTRVQNTAERMVKELTIAPITSGLQEYETQINAVQTILANTESKGTTLGQVNAALDQLNTYADKTIYNFTEMTKNIGTFTAAGVDLNTSVNAIQGIANLAAVSGSSSQQASTAMYQLSQALASGTVKLMDWNSVVNAGMGGQVFQDALKETARIHGKNIDAMIEKHGSFRETLQEGWLTSDILTETLSHFTMAAEEGSAEWEKYKKSLMDDGYTEEQAKAILKLSNTATDAATKVKTATQLWDTLKETAQSGWTQTWEIILGDFGEAKKLFSGIYETISPILEETAKARNELLMGGLASGWKQLLGQGISDEEGYRESIKNVAKDHGIAIDDMIKAEKELDSSLDDNEAFQNVLQKGLKDGSINSDMLTKSVTNLADKMRNMSEEEREAAGYTQEHLTQIEALEKGLKDGSISMDEFTEKMMKPSGRENIIDALFNSFKAVMSVISPIKQAFSEIFPALKPEQLYAFTEAIRDFTAKLTLSDTASENLKRTFTGVFAVFDILRQAFVAVVKAIAPLFGGLDNLGGGILDVTASWGDWLVALDESIKKSGFFNKFVESVHKGLEKVKTFLEPVIEGFNKFKSAVSDAFSDFSVKAEGRLEPLAALGNFIKNVFVGIGNVIKKIFPYVSAAATGIGNVLKSLMDTITSAFQNADYDNIFDFANGGIITAIGIYIAKMFKSGSGIFDGAAGFVENINNILEGVGDALGAFTDSLKAETLKKIATAIAILAASLLVLSLIPSDKLTTSLVAITTLFGELMGAMAILSKLGDMKGVVKIAGTLVTLSAALLVLSVALKIMSTMSWSEMGVGLISLTVGLGALVGAVNLLPKKKVKGAAKAIKTMSAAVLILAIGIKIMSAMSWEEMGIGLISMAVGLGAMVAAVNLLPKDTALRAAGMLGLATSMVVLGAALKIMATMSWGDVARSLVTLGGSLLLLALGMNMMVSALPGAAAMLIVTPALLLLSAALKVMATLSWGDIARGLVVLGGSLLIIAVAMAAMFVAIPGATALLIVAAGLAVLTPVLMTLGSMSLSEIGKSLLMIAGVFAVLGIAAIALMPLIPAIIALTGSLTLLGIACVAIGAGVAMLGIGLATIAVAGSAAAVSLVTIVSSLISLIPYLIEQIGVGIIKLCEVIAGSSVAICDAFTVIVLALVDALVTSVPYIVEGALVLIDELLSALIEFTPRIVAGLYDFIIGVINSIAEKLPDLIQAGVNLLMSFFSGVVDALKSVDPSVLVNGLLAIGVLAAIVAAMAAVALLTPAAMIGVIGMGAVVTELAFVLAAIGALAQIPGLEWLVSEGGNFLQTVGTAIGQFVGGLVGGFGQGVSASLPQIGTDLSTFMSNASGFIEGAKSIDASAMEGVKSLAGVILALTAADILQGLTSWITGGSSLTKFGEELAAFGPNMKAYADSVSGIDASTVVASATAAQALAEMTSHIPNEGGMVAWFTGENSISKFGNELVTLGMGLRMYSLAITGFNAEAVIASANAATALADMTSHIPNEGGVAAWFAGENSISKFGTELVNLGMSLAMYSMVITGFNAEAVIASANAATALVDMTSNIPNEGGMVAWFTGENSVASWGNQLVSLGMSLSMYSMAITGFNAEAVIASANAATALMDMTSKIPNEGGVAAWFAGENSISKFGTDLIALGTGLKGFSDKVSGINAETVIAAAKAAQALAVMASYVPNEGGVVAWFTGDNSIAKFGEKLPELGDGLKGFSDSVEGISPENIAAASKAAKTLAEMANTAPADSSVLVSFSTNLVTFGGSLKDYFNEIGDVTSATIKSSTDAIKSVKDATSGITPSNFTNAASAIDKLVDSIKKMSKINSSAADGFSSAIKKLADTNVKSMLTAFKNAGSDMKNAGKDLIQKFIDGVESKNSNMKKSGQSAIDKFVAGIKSRESKVKSACKNIASSCASAVRDKYTAFYNAGSYLVTGFASGISENTWRAEATAKVMANAAEKAAKEALDINSPSKVFRAIGYSVPEGFAMGIDKMSNMVTASSINMASKAINSVKSSISRIADLVNTDIDSQPTIRPVLDLSDVRSGVGAIGSLFGGTKSIGVQANVSAISSMMNNRNQNGAASDVISAIDKLRKDLSNVGNTTYSINGVTYDDGSNIAEAVKTITRAAIRERRV